MKSNPATCFKLTYIWCGEIFNLITLHEIVINSIIVLNTECRLKIWVFFFIQSIEYFFKVNGWWSEWNGNWGVFQPRGFPIIQRDLSIIPRDRGSQIVMWWKSHVVFFCWNDVLVTRIWLLQLQSLNLQECGLFDIGLEIFLLKCLNYYRVLTQCHVGSELNRINDPLASYRKPFSFISFLHLSYWHVSNPDIKTTTVTVIIVSDTLHNQFICYSVLYLTLIKLVKMYTRNWLLELVFQIKSVIFLNQMCCITDDLCDVV